MASAKLLQAAALAVIAASGLTHGVVTKRWGQSDDLARAVERLTQVPKVIGDWTAEDVPISEQDLKIGGIAGYLSRRYVNQLEGQTVSVVVVCGAAGPIAVHTPESCLPGAGFIPHSASNRYQVTGDGRPNPSEFWVANFSRGETALAEHLRIFWSWNANQQWQVPDNPRIAFAGKRVLHKLYVTRGIQSGAEPLDDDACVRFLRTFLPELERAIHGESPANLREDVS